MAFANRIKVTTSTTGTGSLTLSATGVRDATNGDALAPAEVLSEIGNRLASYFITSGGNFAYGQGPISADGMTLSRDPNEMSWNGTTYAAGLLSLTGTSTVIISPEASDLSASSIGLSSAIARGAVTL
jgi:hypothetical protein